MMRRILVTVLVVAAGSAAGIGERTGYEAVERGALRRDGEGLDRRALRFGAMDGWRRDRRVPCSMTTGKSYVWSMASDAPGNGYLGLGGTAAGSAVVMKVTPDGKASQMFEGKELAVQAVRVAADGSLLVATSPDGKVYRVPASGGGRGDPVVVFDPATTEEKPKYLWDLAVGKGGEVYVAAGAPAVVYRVPAGGGKAEVLFKTADQHIRCLLMGPDGTLWAGSDGSGVIYKFATGTRGSEAVCGVFGGAAGDYGAGDGCGGECVCGGSGDEGTYDAAAAAGDGKCGGDDYVCAAGVVDGGGSEYAGAGWVGDLQDCGGWVVRRSW